jgi:hypothetical protein
MLAAEPAPHARQAAEVAGIYIDAWDDTGRKAISFEIAESRKLRSREPPSESFRRKFRCRTRLNQGNSVS